MAAAASDVSVDKEKPFAPHAFWPELEPLVDLVLPLFELFSQHFPPWNFPLYVQCVQEDVLKQRRAQVLWLIPFLLERLLPEYFTPLSMTQPGE